MKGLIVPVSPLLWDPTMDPQAPARGKRGVSLVQLSGKHKGRVVVLTVDIFAEEHDGIICQSGGGQSDSFAWERNALYIAPAVDVARMRARARTWGGYDEEGALALNNRHRDFDENLVPAIRVARREDVTPEQLADLMKTPGPTLAIVSGPNDAIVIEELYETRFIPHAKSLSLLGYHLSPARRGDQ